MKQLHDFGKLTIKALSVKNFGIIGWIMSA